MNFIIYLDVFIVFCVENFLIFSTWKNMILIDAKDFCQKKTKKGHNSLGSEFLKIIKKSLDFYNMV